MSLQSGWRLPPDFCPAQPNPCLDYLKNWLYFRWVSGPMYGATVECTNLSYFISHPLTEVFWHGRMQMYANRMQITHWSQMPGALLILELDRVVAQLSGCSPGDQKSPHALPLMGRMEAGAEGNSRKDAPCCRLFLPFDCCRSGLPLFSQRQLKRERDKN